MTRDDRRRLGPGVREVVGDDQLDEIGTDGPTAWLRPARPGRSLLVLHQPAPDVVTLLDEVDRLTWLAGRGPGPAVLACGRTDKGDEAAVVRLPADATPAVVGHPLGPEALIESLAATLSALHALPCGQCPFDASTARLRGLVADAVRARQTPVAADGPYAGRDPAELLQVFDDLSENAGDGATAFIHAGLRADRVWFAPDGTVTFLGWSRSGVGDSHVDLAAAATMVHALHGPALVAPLLAAYGLDRIDPARLDAAQLLVHLLP